ncbi:hypothetical protein pipiens_018627 [Culex pipiens pipiens]|uniref:Uncharacterized protein n=1 Tax=Culex pipiens pipiens TaxID=38569 RepID=A0ABD1CAY7_CULPP
MKNLLILIAILAVARAKSIDIDPSQVQPFESIGIDWSQVQPIEDSDQYWDRLPADLQYLRKPEPDRRIGLLRAMWVIINGYVHNNSRVAQSIDPASNADAVRRCRQDPERNCCCVISS